MCAIAGVIGLSYNETILKNMEQTMLRRGPDERGINRGDGFALIHRRLTIVDPQGGKQPMSLDFGGEQYTIVYTEVVFILCLSFMMAKLSCLSVREVRHKKIEGSLFQTLL